MTRCLKVPPLKPPSTALTKTRSVKPDDLRSFCTRLLGAAGLRPKDAQLVADSLVESNLRGVDSHGVARLPHYLDRITHGSINPRPKMRLTSLAPALARIDGDHGFGQLVMHRAAREAIDLARQSGAGWVSVCNSSHCGSLAYFGLPIAAAGMIGLVFTHVDPMVLPHGARQPFCGTNPLCLTAPGQGGKALCLDMATSIVSWNKVANAVMEGKSIPLGWAVNAQGRDTTDASTVTALYPMGNYKGSGLGLMIDVLCALLSNAPYGPDIPKMYGNLAQRRLLGGLVGAIDIRRFVPLDQFQSRVSELIERWGVLPPIKKGGRVLYPGEPELLAKEQRLREGIPLPEHLIATFDRLSQESRMERPSSTLLVNAAPPETP